MAARPSLVAPFTGERYAARDRLAELIAPPYDVISPQERKVLARRSKHNIVHLLLPEENGDKYARAAERLAVWRSEGILVADPGPRLSVLRQEFRLPDGSRRVRTGVIGGVAVEPFATRRVRPHEKTHREPKADRLALVRATRTIFDAVLMLASDEGGNLQAILGEVTAGTAPTASAELQGVQLSLWQVAAVRAKRIAAAAGSGPLYIADGHHRYETAIGYRDENPAARRIPALIVPLGDPGLALIPTHRVVRHGTLDAEAFLQAMRARFQIKELPGGMDHMEELAGLKDRGTACVVLTPDSTFLLLLKRGGSGAHHSVVDEPPVASLDAVRLDELVVKPLLAAAGSDARLGYTADPAEVVHGVRRGALTAGVLVNPPRLTDVIAVADADAVMPPKSTYFTPKVPSGLVMLRYEDGGAA